MRDEEHVDEVLVLDRGRHLAPAATPLRLVVADRLRLCVTRVRKRDHHVLPLDQVLDRDVFLVGDDFRTPRVGIGILDLVQLRPNDLQQPFRASKDVPQVADQDEQVGKLRDDLVLFEPGQAVQAQVEDGLGLHVRQPVLPARKAPLARHVVRAGRDLARALQHGRHDAGAPAAGDQRRLGLGRRRGRLDGRDDLVDVGQGDCQAFQDVGAVAGLAQVVEGPARDDLAAMPQKGVQHFLQRQQLGLAVHQRHHVHAEHRLERRQLVELVEDDLGVLVALQLDDDAQAVLVRLVAQLRDTLDRLLPHEVRYALEQAGLVDLVGQLRDDDRLATALVDLLELGAGADVDPTAAGLVGKDDLGGTVDDAGRREIRTRHQLHQLDETEVRVVDQRDAGVDDLAEVVWRDIGRHADRDSRGTVDQQVGNPGRQDGRLVLAVVIVCREIDGFLLDVGQQFLRQARHADFGVAHRRGRVAVDRTKVALTVHQQVAHREGLRHPDDRVVNGDVAVRMIFADDVADDARRLLVGLVPVVAQFPHGVQDATVNRLESIADVR